MPRLAANHSQAVQAAVPRHHLEKIEEAIRHPPLEKAVQDRHFLLVRHQGRAQDGFHLGESQEEGLAQQGVELLENRLRLAGLLRRAQSAAA